MVRRVCSASAERLLPTVEMSDAGDSPTNNNNGSPSNNNTALEYEYNDLVFGKLFGFPWWPARVTGKPLADSGRVPTRFFHTGERLNLKPTDLKPYAADSDMANVEKVNIKKPRAWI